MSSITTADVQHLRQQTGVGMMDAKHALEATAGNLEAAIEHLRKTGQKIVAAKSARQVKAGTIGVWVSADKRQGTIVAVACETDFVARTDDFRTYANRLAAHLGDLNEGSITPEDFLDRPGPDRAQTVRQSLERVIATMGENIQISQLAVLVTSSGTIDSYLHANNTVAALVAIDGGTSDVSHDLTLHIAALHPQFLSAADVPALLINRERDIYREQLKAEGKPEAMWEKIIPGKLQKFYRDVCLLDQPFVKDDSVSVSQYLKSVGGATVTGFARIAI